MQVLSLLPLLALEIAHCRSKPENDFLFRFQPFGSDSNWPETVNLFLSLWVLVVLLGPLPASFGNSKCLGPVSTVGFGLTLRPGNCRWFLALPKKSWCNTDNQRFYSLLSSGELEKIADDLGLNNAIDIGLLRPYWQEASSLLDIGAGYGRVIEGLRLNNFAGEITALEVSASMADHIRKHCVGIDVVCQDFMVYQNSRLYDVITWLWCGVADFNVLEQKKQLKNCL